jgi:hypothetical protein
VVNLESMAVAVASVPNPAITGLEPLRPLFGQRAENSHFLLLVLLRCACDRPHTLTRSTPSGVGCFFCFC